METTEHYWLTRDETATRLKIPRKTLAQWASQGRGPRFSKIGRFARYKLVDVIAWEDAQATGGEGAA
ncbi:helix-turn-helix domain-containing protein [Rhodococcoides fascians A25f]|uniref:helix-turn-helix transcriptional regulator n=1 Tax=Rhodococcoides fascians TaxID=1828 RepID=UPI00055B24F0|nr:helix-turn-helix domain-containing protein [Rhodococcus fascians]QII05912.1 helix-turn-helix domain-containing protein [Rhodococcus fascians A25f]